MDKALWGKRIADKIHASEKNIDVSIKSIMELVTEIQACQADLNVSAVATDPTFGKLMESLALLQQARTSVVAGHRRVEKLGDGLGIRPVGIGAGKYLVEDGVPTTATDERRAAI